MWRSGLGIEDKSHFSQTKLVSKIIVDLAFAALLGLVLQREIEK
jgi:hypothetical protein